jgi:hypothetical protein
MVIFVINNGYIWTVELECDAPIAAHTHCPRILSVPFQLMQIQSGQVHIAGTGGDVQSTQDKSQSTRVSNLNACFGSREKEFLQTFVLEVLDHSSIITCNVTGCKWLYLLSFQGHASCCQPMLPPGVARSMSIFAPSSFRIVMSKKSYSTAKEHITFNPVKDKAEDQEEQSTD